VVAAARHLEPVSGKPCFRLHFLESPLGHSPELNDALRELVGKAARGALATQAL